MVERHTRGGHPSYQGEMWRATVFPENENSDQSISEDDDLDGDLSEDHVSLGIPAEEKGKVQILSQLDMLRDANEVMHERHETSLLQKRQADICVEDDVEFPYFATKSKFTYNPQGCNSDEEIVSDNEVGGNWLQLSKYFTSEADKYQKMEPPSSFGGNRADGICTWLAANTEAADADCGSFQFHPVSARSKRSCKGGQDKAKAKGKCKFSFRTQLHKDHLFEDEDGTTTTVKCNKTKSTSEQLADKKRSILSVSDNRYTDIDIEDDPNCLVSDSESSEEDKAPPPPHEPKQKTIADQFHEALGAASTNEDGGHMYAVSRHTHTGFGLFGKLQHVMRMEKERDLYFLSKLQKQDEEGSFEVKILSRSWEGKLTVCSCSCSSSCSRSSIENEEQRKNLSIIFSSRICGDVDLDVGMMVRIHPPWKQVNVKGKQHNTILSTYYSQI
ncbi:unnamed protein product [Lactuca virosa]|uniref:Uncharacterized protein n=1 Tax=Lactuca virosa TaxID=75947 RepID=A0AAU9PB29_9ASTR|nr:unnamed protein product [Lactuca virosa]